MDAVHSVMSMTSAPAIVCSTVALFLQAVGCSILALGRVNTYAVLMLVLVSHRIGRFLLFCSVDGRDVPSSCSLSIVIHPRFHCFF